VIGSITAAHEVLLLLLPNDEDDDDVAATISGDRRDDAYALAIVPSTALLYWKHGISTST